MIGIYIDNLMLPWAEHIFRLSEKMDITLFLNNFSPFDVHTKMGVLASHHLWSFNGTVIAGDTFSARYLADCPIPKRRLFYINHIDWCSNAFNALDTTKAASLELLCQPDLELAVKSVWGPATPIMDWNYEGLQRILGK